MFKDLKMVPTFSLDSDAPGTMARMISLLTPLSKKPEGFSGFSPAAVELEGSVTAFQQTFKLPPPPSIPTLNKSSCVDALLVLMKLTYKSWNIMANHSIFVERLNSSLFSLCFLQHWQFSV